MVESATDKGKGTAPIKPIRKSWAIGSIPATDKDFLEWRKDQSLVSYGCTVLEGMVHYVNQLNFESGGERYEREMKEYKALLLSAETNDTDGDPDQTTEPAKVKAHTQNIPESQSQEQSNHPILEHPSQNSPPSPLPSSLPPTAPRAEQVLWEQRAEQNLNANRTVRTVATVAI